MSIHIHPLLNCENMDNILRIADQMPNLFGIKGLNSEYLFANRTLSDLLAFPSPKYMIENQVTDRDSPTGIAEFADQFMKEDQQVLETGQENKYIELGCFAGDTWKIILGQKSLLKDNNDNKLGVLINYIDITNNNILRQGLLLAKEDSSRNGSYKLKQFSYAIQESYLDLDLPARQNETLFYLLRGKTIKEIAQILRLSPRTIEHYVTIVKNKLSCQSKKELIEKAVDLDLINIIPRTLFKVLCEKE